MLGNTSVCLCLQLVVAFATGVRQKRVVGGTQYPDGEYKFQVSLWYMGSNNYYTKNTPDLHHTCGGSLLTKNWVLTSAVCFDNNFLSGVEDPNNYEVVIGMYAQTNAKNVAQFRKFEKIVKSPEYNLVESYGDVALLRLSEPVNLTDPRVGTVKYNTNSKCPTVGQTCTVIGWGQTKEVPYGAGSNYPHATDVIVDSEEHCRSVYTTEAKQKEMGPIRIDSRSLCAGLPEGGADACFGDSGSPMLCKCVESQGNKEEWVVAATVSTGYGCANAGYPAIYSRISEYSQFIKDTIDADP